MILAAWTGQACAEVKKTIEKGKDWEKVEEPALRPYKGMWRGVKAFGYQCVKSVAEGNKKCPVFGTLELSRGIRKGTVELVSSTCKGASGSKPAPVEEISKANDVIDNNPVLKNTTDTIAGAYALGFGAGTAHANTHVIAAGCQLTAQKVIDQRPADPEFFNRMGTRLKAFESGRKKAQRDYIGDRADTNDKLAQGRGNLLKIAE